MSRLRDLQITCCGNMWNDLIPVKNVLAKGPLVRGTELKLSSVNDAEVIEQDLGLIFCLEDVRAEGRLLKTQLSDLPCDRDIIKVVYGDMTLELREYHDEELQQT